jgi:hypothetical protein
MTKKHQKGEHQDTCPTKKKQEILLVIHTTLKRQKKMYNIWFLFVQKWLTI